MHELSLAQALIETAENTLKELPESRIVSMTIEVGQLAGISIDALEFCMPMVTKDTAADGCTVTFEEIPGKATCLECSHPYPMDDFFIPCPACGSSKRDILQGKEFTLKHMEVA